MLFAIVLCFFVISFNYLYRDTIFIFLLLAVSIAGIFSYIIAHITLTPVRRTLRSQKRFISDIAHELRTPLAIIKTNCEVALLDAVLEESIENVFKSNIEELDRTSAIINNLLSFNNLITPEKVPFGKVDMSDVVEKALKRLDKLVATKQMKINFEKKPGMIVLGNETALDQIATNIIKNALNYSASNKLITIAVDSNYRDNIIFTVKDNGIGIDQKDLLHIFEPFYRAESSRSRHSGSSGLGLTIVSELLKLHRGSIFIKSRLGKGTTMEISLPYIKP